MHLPKTGGSSALAALKRHLPESQIATIAFGHHDDADNLDLSAFREKSLLHGHFSARWSGMFQRSTSVAVCLRDPSQVTRSFYKYFLAFKPDELTGRQALIRKSAENGFKGYLQHMRTDRAGQYYMHFLDPLYGAPGHSALEGASLQKSVDRAKHFLDHCDIVGITEKVEAFVMAILCQLGINAEHVEVGRVNVSSNLASEFPERFIPVALDEQSLDAETEELLLELNRPMVEIYEHARSLSRHLDMKSAQVSAVQFDHVL